MKPDLATVPIRQRLCDLLPRLRRFARSLTGNPHDADDVVQIALERALQRTSQWREEAGGLDAWMFGIVRNAWLDEVRSRQRRGRMFAPEEDGLKVGVATVDTHLQGVSVEAAMARLPADQREAVALVLVEGFSYREAAAVLEVPMGTLTSRLARGRQALQSMLGDSN
ncbi:MAG: sigma-70 family RNA polymerase sigma factor [Lysobacter sp.]